MFSSQYEREESQPDEICLSYTHDRDFVVFKDYPSIDCNPYYQALSDDDDEDINDDNVEYNTEDDEGDSDNNYSLFVNSLINTHQ